MADAALDAYEPPDPKRPHRLRPHVQGSVAPEVGNKLSALHARRGGPFAHTLDEVLRRGLEAMGELSTPTP